MTCHHNPLPTSDGHHCESCELDALKARMHTESQRLMSDVCDDLKARLREEQDRCRHLDHTATLAKERADRAEAERDAMRLRFNVEAMRHGLTSEERDALRDELERVKESDERHVRELELCYGVQQRLTDERDALRAALAAEKSANEELHKREAESVPMAQYNALKAALREVRKNHSRRIFPQNLSKEDISRIDALLGEGGAS